MFVTIAALVFLFISSNKAHTPGTVTVDTFTINKILQTFDNVLVKFDDKYPYGEKYDAFKKFAEYAANTKKFIIAEVPITDHGEKENEQLAKEYDIKKEDYPVYKLFLKSKSKPIEYTGDKTEDDLKRFVTQHTNLWFGLPGTIEALDYIAREFFDASSSNDANAQKTILEKAREHIKSFSEKKEQKSGESYIKIMEAVVKQGTEFLKREGRRVQNLLKGKITNEKKEELNHRSNILLSFQSLKETVSDTIDTAKETIADAAEKVKEAVVGDKDL